MTSSPKTYEQGVREAAELLARLHPMWAAYIIKTLIKE